MNVKLFVFCCSVNDTYQIIPVTNDSNVDEVMLLSLDKFGLDPRDINRYRLVEVSLEKGGQCLGLCGRVLTDLF